MNTRKRVYGEHSSPPVANLREDEVEVVESRSISTQSRRYTFKLGSSATASAAAILDLKSPLTRVTSTSTTTVADHSFDTRPPPKKRQRRSKWTKKDDEQLVRIVNQQGLNVGNVSLSIGSWTEVAEQLGTSRNAKQCRDRWQNYLRPGLKKGDWTNDEEDLIRDMFATFGPRWSAMAKMFPSRTDNDIKNKWYSMARSEKRLSAKLGFPTAPKPPPSQSVAPYAFQYHATVPNLKPPPIETSSASIPPIAAKKSPSVNRKILPETLRFGQDDAGKARPA